MAELGKNWVCRPASGTVFVPLVFGAATREGAGSPPTDRLRPAIGTWFPRYRADGVPPKRPIAKDVLLAL